MRTVDRALLDRELRRIYGERGRAEKAVAHAVERRCGLAPQAVTQREIGLGAGYTSLTTVCRALQSLVAAQVVVAEPVGPRRWRYAINARFAATAERRAV
jgi:hypothetical protein